MQRSTEPQTVFNALESARHADAAAQESQVQVNWRSRQDFEVRFQRWNVEAASGEGDPKPPGGQSLWKFLQVSAANEETEAGLVENAGDGRLEQRPAFGLDVEERRFILKLPIQPPVFPRRDQLRKGCQIPGCPRFAGLFDPRPRQGVDPVGNRGSSFSGGEIVPGGDPARPEVPLAPRSHARNQLKGVPDHPIAVFRSSISGRSASQNGSLLISRG